MVRQHGLRRFGDRVRWCAPPFWTRTGSSHLIIWMTIAYLNRVATSVPQYDVHAPFVGFAEGMLEDARTRSLFRRMSRMSGIAKRHSVLNPSPLSGDGSIDAGGFYRLGNFPSTRDRMKIFEATAPAIARCAVDRLALREVERCRIRHVIVTCCTGFYAPGLDFEVMNHLGLPHTTERTMIGFMGCYAAFNGLKMARHLIRSEPDSAVLMLNLELCTLHLQETQDLEQVLSFLLFSDGCAASLVSAEPRGFALDDFRSTIVPDSPDLITWRVGDTGFDMHLSGRVPGEIGRTLRASEQEILAGKTADAIDLWAVHPGGRSVLDAVEQALLLPPEALHDSRTVLECFGNMSSATVMFVIERMLAGSRPGQQGCAMAFGPGLTAETFLFHAV